LPTIGLEVDGGYAAIRRPDNRQSLNGRHAATLTIEWLPRYSVVSHVRMAFLPQMKQSTGAPGILKALRSAQCIDRSWAQTYLPRFVSRNTLKRFEAALINLGCHILAAPSTQRISASTEPALSIFADARIS
jgi:hypothetical protein